MESMNRLLTQQLEKLAALEQRIGGQSGAYSELASSAEEATTATGDMSSAIEAAGASAEESEGMFSKFVNSMKKFKTDIAEKWKKFTQPLMDALQLLGVNFESLTDIITNPLSAAFGFLRTAYNSIIEKAADLAKEQYKLLDAFEKVRDKFGSFSDNTSRRIKTGYEQFSGSLRAAAGNSTAFASKFQMGIDGAVQQLEKIAEIAGDLGPIFDAMGQQFNDATAELYVLKDGLHFTDQGLQQTARLAMLNGKSVKQFSQEIMASVDKIGKNFGVSTKVLGADVGKALSNFKMLGKMTGDYVKQITQAATFTRKLGFELTELTGLVDKFDDFEQGAEAAAQLAQGFGLVLDPLKMMNMEDPAARLQEVQRAFTATGRSVESMTRQERALLASTSGLSEEILTQALSAKGLSQSYDDIVKGADAASKKQKSTQEVMNDLADNIKNVITPFKEFTGFVSAFIEGFLRGFGTSGGMMSVLKPLAAGMLKVAKIGGEVGAIVAELFFGKQTDPKSSPLVSLANTISTMFIGIATSIKDFFTAIRDGDIVGAVDKLFTGIFDSVSNAFGGGTAGFDFGAMVNKFGLTIIKVLTGVVKWLPKQLTIWTKSLSTMFVETVGKDGKKGLTDGFGAAIDGLIDALPDLGKALMGFGEELLKALPRFFKSFKITTLFATGGPIIVALSGIANQLWEMLGSVFGSSATSAAASGAAGTAGAGAAISGLAGGVKTVGAAAVAPVVEKSQDIISRIFDVLEEPAKITAMAGAIAIAISTIGVAIRDVLLAFMDPLPGRTPKQSFVDVVVDSANKFQSVEWDNLGKLGVVLAAVGVGIGAMVAVIATQASKFSAMQGIAFLIGGAYFAAGLSLLPTGGGEGFFGKLLGGVGSVIKDIVKPFGDAEFTTGLTTISAMASDVDKLATASSSLGKLMGALLEIGSVLPTKYLGLGGTDFEALRQPMVDVISILQGDTENPGILSLLSKISVPAGLDTIATKITPAATIMTTIKGIVTSLTGFGNLQAAYTTLSQLNNSNFNIIANLSTLASKLNGMTKVDVTVSGNVSSIKSSLDKVSEITKAIMGLTSLAELKTKLVDLNGTSIVKANATLSNPGIIELLGRISENFNKHFKTPIIPEVSQNIADTATNIANLSKIKESIDKIGDVTTTLTNAKGLNLLIPEVYTTMGNAAFWFDPTMLSVLTEDQVMDSTDGINRTFDVLLAFADSMDMVMQKVTTEKLDEFAGRTEAIIEHTRKMKDMLENLDTIPIDATIDQMGRNMKIARKIMEINGGAVKVAVQVNLTMNAEKMAAGLVASGYIEPTTGFGEYMQNNDGIGEQFNNPTNKYESRTDNATWRGETRGKFTPIGT